MIRVSSVERVVDVALDEDANAAVATIVERRELELDDLFQDGELRLWENTSGWDGFLREETGGAVVYYSVNRLDDGSSDEWIRKLRVGEQAVRDGIRHHIEDPDAGRAGRFVRSCSPQVHAGK